MIHFSQIHNVLRSFSIVFLSTRHEESNERRIIDQTFRVLVRTDNIVGLRFRQFVADILENESKFGSRQQIRAIFIHRLQAFEHIFVRRLSGCARNLGVHGGESFDVNSIFCQLRIGDDFLDVSCERVQPACAKDVDNLRGVNFVVSDFIEQIKSLSEVFEKVFADVRHFVQKEEEEERLSVQGYGSSGGQM